MYISTVVRFCRALATGALSLAAVLTVLQAAAFAQQLDRIQREQARGMLSNIKKSIEKNYYDPEFHGVNLNERFAAADEKLKQAPTLGAAFGIIAQAVIDLNDSHTRFVPPARNVRVEYGWQMAVIGDKPYIIAVKPKSDAERKGLKVGDLVVSVNNFRPTRSELWKMMYYYYYINPQAGVKMVVQSPGDAQPRELEVMANVKQLKRVLDLNSDFDINELIRDIESESRSEVHRFQRIGNVVVWNMPSFSFTPDQVDTIMQGRVKGSGSLVLDLRGNPGGYVKTLERLAGYFFDKEVKIADLKRRKDNEVSKTVPHGDDTFKGNVVVLVDSRSGSAAEIFARLMQIEKRGIVIGDRSAGAVMQSRSFPMEMGTDKIVRYTMSVTDADVIMTDGKSIEHVGVTPDETILLTGADLAAFKDPALARAVEKAGGQISPEAAGKLFPIEWDN
jgi:C-terminal processing protease CtpA/Prc